jgi:hypothetical protein
VNASASVLQVGDWVLVDGEDRGQSRGCAQLAGPGGGGGGGCLPTGDRFRACRGCPWSRGQSRDSAQPAGRAAEAEAAYRQAIASGHADEAPKAAVNLGILLRAQGRPEANQSE